MNSTFQEQLKQIDFKTFFRKQMATFDYENLFSNRRVLIFSLTNIRVPCSVEHFHNFEKMYLTFLENGIDDVCVVDSFDLMIGPWTASMADRWMQRTGKPDTLGIKGLPDRDQRFVKLLAEHYEYNKPVKDLARFWQYVTIINDGEPEKIWSNPFNAEAPLRVLKHPDYRYRKLSADTVLKYLLDNKQ